jgi:hypothetical protein
VREPGRGGRAERAQLRMREGHAAGAVGVLAIDQRRQSPLHRPGYRSRGPGADHPRAGRQHRLVAEPPPPLQPRRSRGQPHGRGTGGQQHHRRRDRHQCQRHPGCRARPGVHGGGLPALHRLARPGDPSRVPGAVRGAADRGGYRQPGQRRVRPVDDRRPGKARGRRGRPVRQRRQPRQPAGAGDPRQPPTPGQNPGPGTRRGGDPGKGPQRTKEGRRHPWQMAGSRGGSRRPRWSP